MIFMIIIVCDHGRTESRGTIKRVFGRRAAGTREIVVFPCVYATTPVERLQPFEGGIVDCISMYEWVKSQQRPILRMINEMK